jgi:GTP cyclohydrolase I
VIRAWAEWTGGYHVNPADVLKSFEDGASRDGEMVLVTDIPIYSHCEHHLAPFFGHAHIAYVPAGRIVGLSKLARLVNVFAHRLQVQERMTDQIADAFYEFVQPVGVAIVARCRHMCMESRGIRTQNSSTLTSATRGSFATDSALRGEFLAMLGLQTEARPASSEDA